MLSTTDSYRSLHPNTLFNNLFNFKIEILIVQLLVDYISNVIYEVNTLG